MSKTLRTSKINTSKVISYSRTINYFGQNQVFCHPKTNVFKATESMDSMTENHSNLDESNSSLSIGAEDSEHRNSGEDFIDVYLLE